LSVTIGTQLGSHELIGLLGKGGMGEVYRARDTKLKREVAIKILPDEFSNDPNRLSRFQREAEVLASLNHPNIAGIHSLEDANGWRFLVLELVEGETLAERIKRGPLPIDESLNIAKSICEALEAAHERGIIHRDLKPANVKTTPEGKVKVLDFGLAKALEVETSKGNLSNSPTMSMMASNAGLILGTAAYMSPEQAKGKPVDRRTDVFAFGCVLYEMLTGRPVFEGETVSDILARVIEREPDWKRLPSGLSPRIHELLRRCLEKDPKKRRRDMGDVLMDLDSPFPLGELAAPPARRVRVAMAAIFILGTLAALLAVPAVLYFRSTPTADASETRLDIVTPATTDPISFALSPDGRQIVFVGTDDGGPRLWLRPLDKTTAQPMAGSEGASYPFWSPDSRSVGFFANGKLMRIDLAGGSPQTLAGAAIGRGGTWGPDGVILFSPSLVDPLFRIKASGGDAVAITKLDKQTNHRFPQFLPGGRQFLFYAVGTPETAGIYLGSLDAPETKRLTAADTAGLYAPSGWLLFVRQGTLVARRFDSARGELTGDPVRVADRVGVDLASGNLGAFSVSAAGLVSYRSGDIGRRQLTWFDRSGKVLGKIGAPDENGVLSPRLSPDGHRVAVNRTVQGNFDIWLLDAVRTTRFTFDASLDLFPVWSPDGSRIVFRSNRKGTTNLYQKPSNGAGSDELLVESPQDKTATAWSPDGRFLLYVSVDPKTTSDIWVLPLEGDRKPFVFLKTGFAERFGQFSPDGHWVAYTSNESGRYEIYVRPFPGPGGQWQVSAAGGLYPRWRPDGKELYYIAPDGKLMAAPIAPNGTALDPGMPVVLFQSRAYGGGTDAGGGWQYDVSRDGRFLINTVLDDASSPITLIQNWHPEPGK
jgi:eukaryotic-like serine/threonine-protein kinase